MRFVTIRSYGFQEEENLPSPLTGADLPLPSLSWLTTGEFSQDAKNHCASIMVSNLLLLLTAQRRESPSEKTHSEIFSIVYPYVGNGPVMFTAEKVHRAGREFHIEVESESLSVGEKGFSAYCRAIDQGKPVAVLLQAGLADWHWVLGVGYRRDRKGEAYLHVITGWRDSLKEYLCWEGPAKIRAMTAYSGRDEKMKNNPQKSFAEKLREKSGVYRNLAYVAGIMTLYELFGKRAWVAGVVGACVTLVLAGASFFFHRQAQHEEAAPSEDSEKV